MCYPLVVFRRTLTAALVLSLIGFEPAPLSACALFSSKLAECVTPQTESQCDGMDTGESGPHFVAPPDQSCCFARAPLPLTLYKAPVISVVLGPAAGFDPVVAARSGQNVRLEPSNQDLSPPRIQSLLCTFLI